MGKRIFATLLAAILLLTGIPLSGFVGLGEELFPVASAATSGDYVYTILEDGTAEITEYTGSGGDIVIPDNLDGYSVTSLGVSSFAGCNSLTTVKIPDTVIRIGEGAFGYCRNLTSIDIPDSVQDIEGWAFDSCNALRKITIPDGVVSIGQRTFTQCYNLIFVSLPSTIVYIDDYAFEGCNALSTVYYAGTQEGWDTVITGQGNEAFLNATCQLGICLTSREIVSFDRYTGNLGDSCIYNLDRSGLIGTSGNPYYRNGNIGIDGTEYKNGLEVWIARWNPSAEISWAEAVYKLDGRFKKLTGKSGLIQGSANSNNFDTTVYFYDGERLLQSYTLTDENYVFDIEVDVTGVDELKILVQDNVAVKSGTSFALYDMFFDDSNLGDALSDTNQNPPVTFENNIAVETRLTGMTSAYSIDKLLASVGVQMHDKCNISSSYSAESTNITPDSLGSYSAFYEDLNSDGYLELVAVCVVQDTQSGMQELQLLAFYSEQNTIYAKAYDTDISVTSTDMSLYFDVYTANGYIYITGSYASGILGGGNRHGERHAVYDFSGLNWNCPIKYNAGISSGSTVFNDFVNDIYLSDYQSIENFERIAALTQERESMIRNDFNITEDTRMLLFTSNFDLQNETDCIWDAKGFYHSDADRIPDDWEVNGIDIDGDGIPELDLAAMGADKNVPDIFVEIDWMVRPEKKFFFWVIDPAYSFRPSESVLRTVYEAFQAHGINLHLDAGRDSTDFVTGEKWGDLSGGNELTYTESLNADLNADTWNNLLDMSGIRALVFHHCIFGDLLCSDPSNTTSGMTPGFGQYFAVTLGGWGTVNDTTIAGTFMHELGHSLGLHHGGCDDENYKPNYLSIMNYSFQTTGLAGTGNLNYSDYELPDIDEANINEIRGIDPMGITVGTNLATTLFTRTSAQITTGAIARAPIDMNGNGTLEESISLDLNPQGNFADDPIAILKSFNDWNAIKYHSGTIGSTADLDEVPEVRVSAGLSSYQEKTLDESLETATLAADGTGCIEIVSPTVVKDVDNQNIYFDITNLGANDATFAVEIQSEILFDTYKETVTVSGSKEKVENTRICIPVKSDLDIGEYNVKCVISNDHQDDVHASFSVIIYEPSLEEINEMRESINEEAYKNEINPDILNEIMNVINEKTENSDIPESDFPSSTEPPVTEPAGQEYLLGDVNGDGRVTSADARLILRCAVQLDSLSGTPRLLADLNRDNCITSADARLALRIAVNLEESSTIVVTTPDASTEPSETVPSVTEPPTTEPPETEPPATEPPATEPPTTEPPGTEPTVIEPPTTDPTTPEPTTEPSVVFLPDDGDPGSIDIGDLD